MALISTLRLLIADRLRSDTLFQGPPCVDVLVEDEGDLFAEVTKRLQSGTGLVAVVVEGNLDPNDLAPDSLTVSLAVAVLENPTLNRGKSGTQISAGRLAESVWATLDGWGPGDEWSSLSCQSMAPEPMDGGLMYRVALQTHTVCAVAS